MKVFGIEIRAVGREPKNRERLIVGDSFVGPTSIMGGYLRYGSTDRNWRLEAGQIEANSTIGIGLAKIAKKIAQPRLTVKTINEDGSVTFVQRFELFPYTSPIDGLDEATLNKAVGCCLAVYGNAYLLARRSKTGFLLGYVPLMPYQVTPKNDVHVDGTPNNGNELITRYQITPYGGGAMFYVAPQDLVHFRDGMVDPHNPALGLSAVMSCLRQIVGDNEAANYAATLMTNMGIPGLIFSPKDANAVEPTMEQRKSMRDRFMSFTRDRRGGAMDLPGAFEINKVAMSPSDIKAIEQKVHGMTELLAALGVDPMVLGLPSDSKTYNNMNEAREMFIEDTILPLLSTIAKTLQTAFIKEGLLLQENEELAFDYSCYRELDEDITAKYERAEKAFRAGGSTRGEYRKALGFQDGLDDPRTWFDLNALTKPLPTEKRYTHAEFNRLEQIQLGQ